MTDGAIYERISGIRAELLDVIGEVVSSEQPLEREAAVVQDDLMMVANRLGRVASRLRSDHCTDTGLRGRPAQP